MLFKILGTGHNRAEFIAKDLKYLTSITGETLVEQKFLMLERCRGRDSGHLYLGVERPNCQLLSELLYRYFEESEGAFLVRGK